VNLKEKIYVAGHRGMVGAALCRKLASLGADNIVTRASHELDLTRQDAVEAFFRREKPAYVFLAAAKVGGIVANNTYPADFFHINLAIQNNVIDAAYRNDCRKFLFMGSSCIYPRLCPQPMKEEYLLSGPLEPTNEAYAIAKIAGLMLCRAYRRQYGFDAISVMPTNLYGPGDNFHPQNSHILPALLRRFHEARQAGRKEAVIWGTGSPLREFLHVDDLADACVFLMNDYSGETHVNVGSGHELSTLDLARLVAETVGFTGAIVTDPSKPDGTPRKLLDCSRLTQMGWKPSIALRDGLASFYQWYLEAEAAGRMRMQYQCQDVKEQ
jgi:GDP-L-fucose synthase